MGQYFVGLEPLISEYKGHNTKIRNSHNKITDVPINVEGTSYIPMDKNVIKLVREVLHSKSISKKTKEAIVKHYLLPSIIV